MRPLGDSIYLRYSQEVMWKTEGMYGEALEESVNNGFSDPTKSQIGRDQLRKDVIKEKLSKRAVVKEDGPGECIFKRED